MAIQSRLIATKRSYTPYAVGFSAHLAKIGVSTLGVDEKKRKDRPTYRLAGYVLGAFLAAFVPTMAIAAAAGYLPSAVTYFGSITLLSLAAFACVAAAATAFYLLLPKLSDPVPKPNLIDWAGGILGIVASFLAAGVGLLVSG